MDEFIVNVRLIVRIKKTLSNVRVFSYIYEK